MDASDTINELNENGFCVLKGHFAPPLIEACRKAFWPTWLEYLEKHSAEPNRGPHRHFLPMPFQPPCFAPEFFFDPCILSIVQGVMGARIVADQWGCDVPLKDSLYQEPHIDYQRPLFAEAPGLVLPPYMLIVSFGLSRITADDGAIQIAPGTHRIPVTDGIEALQSGEIGMRAVPLEIGDVLIRYPRTIHRGTPNTTITPRALVTIRYVRQWYADKSRDVNPIPEIVWQCLTPAQQAMMRFPVEQQL